MFRRLARAAGAVGVLPGHEAMEAFGERLGSWWTRRRAPGPVAALAGWFLVPGLVGGTSADLPAAGNNLSSSTDKRGRLV
jgi:hypothetical protein